MSKIDIFDKLSSICVKVAVSPQDNQMYAKSHAVPILTVSQRRHSLNERCSYNPKILFEAEDLIKILEHIIHPEAQAPSPSNKCRELRWRTD